MAKKKSKKKDLIPLKRTRVSKKQRQLEEVMEHYNKWTDDMEQRLTRKYGWNDITDAYYGKLPDDWPYTSKVTDPRIRTSLIEKNARLLNQKLRGRLVPRHSGTAIGARINNAVLDYDWDNANTGGSMQLKMSVTDMDTRLYGTKFCYIPYRTVKDENGVTIFEGNEMIPIDIRDSGMDFASTHVRDAKWFQRRHWSFVEDLDTVSDVTGQPIFPGLRELKKKMNDKDYKSDKRSNEYLSRVKQIKGLDDRMGEDTAFPIVELVDEYRGDEWIIFAPRYRTILATFKNPYIHGKIPVAQLRYYHLQDDPFGESEVEPVIPLWKAIQAVVCGFLDEMNMKMRPPLKVIDGAARVETIVYGPAIQWIMDNPDAVTEVKSSGEAIRYFQVTYSSMVSAFNTAMGDLSQGVSGIDPFNPEKTATEIKQTAKQQNTRDQKNQTDLAEFIKDIMQMWLSNNKQFLFENPEKHEHVMQIIGSEEFNYFQQAGLDEMIVPDEALDVIGEIITQQDGNVSDADINQMMEAGKVPKYPVIENPNEKDPKQLRIKQKMRINDTNDMAELSIVPEDVEGDYDYIADVKSMSAGASEDMAYARQQAIQLLTTNDNVLQLLAVEGYKVKVKELLSATFEELGLRDASRFFEATGGQQALPPGQAGEKATAVSGGANQAPGGVAPTIKPGRVPAPPPASPPSGGQQ